MFFLHSSYCVGELELGICWFVCLVPDLKQTIFHFTELLAGTIFSRELAKNKLQATIRDVRKMAGNVTKRTEEISRVDILIDTKRVNYGLTTFNKL